MSTEQAALEFIVGLSAKGVDTSVQKLVGAFAKVASAAEFANRAILGQTGSPSGGGGGGGAPGSGGGKTTAEKLVKDVNAQISSLTMLKGALIHLGVNVAARAFGYMVSGARTALGWFVEHEKQMTKFRRVMGLSTEELRVFSGSVISSTSLYGANIATVRNLAMELSVGLKNTSKDAVALAASLSQLETISGISADTSKKLYTNLVDYVKVLDPTNIDIFILKTKELSRVNKINADTLLDVIGSHREAYMWNWADSSGRLGPETGKKVLEDTKILGAAIGAARGNMSNLSVILGGLEKKTSAWSDQFRASNGNLLEAVKLVSDLAESTDVSAGGAESFLEQYGMMPAEALKLKEALELVGKVQVDNAAIDKKSKADLIADEKSRMTAYEKLGVKMLEIKDAAIAVGNAIVDWAAKCRPLNDALYLAAELLKDLRKAMNPPGAGKGSEAESIKLAAEQRSEWIASLSDTVTDPTALMATIWDVMAMPLRAAAGTAQKQTRQKYNIDKAVREGYNNQTQTQMAAERDRLNINAQNVTNWKAGNPEVFPGIYASETGTSEKILAVMDSMKNELTDIRKSNGEIRDIEKKPPVPGSSNSKVTAGVSSLPNKPR